jgi:hypothetical protein
MEISFEDLQAKYADMSDDELERIATQDARGLRPEVFGIIEDELKKRKLSPDILKGALAQNRQYTIEELEGYSDLLRNLPCPVCGGAGELLNGTIAYTVKSFIIFTSHVQLPVIACPSCLDKANNNAIISTSLLGWWGIPWGILKTPVYIYRNWKARKQNRVDHANDVLLSYMQAHIGRIEAYKDDRNKLKQVIQVQQN